MRLTPYSPTKTAAPTTTAAPTPAKPPPIDATGRAPLGWEVGFKALAPNAVTEPPIVIVPVVDCPADSVASGVVVAALLMPVAAGWEYVVVGAEEV